MWLVKFLWPFFLKDEQKSEKKKLEKSLNYFCIKIVKSCRHKKIQPNPRVSYAFMAIFL